MKCKYKLEVQSFTMKLIIHSSKNFMAKSFRIGETVIRGCSDRVFLDGPIPKDVLCTKFELTAGLSKHSTISHTRVTITVYTTYTPVILFFVNLCPQLLNNMDL